MEIDIAMFLCAPPWSVLATEAGVQFSYYRPLIGGGVIPVVDLKGLGEKVIRYLPKSLGTVVAGYLALRKPTKL
jgi:hypothetical protein